jgi:hypothetical protein
MSAARYLAVRRSVAVRIRGNVAREVSMLRTYVLDVKDAESTLNRFEVRFALDDEAIRHSKELAASLRFRHFNNHPGLTIAVLDQSSRTIHEEVVYPEDQQK